MNDERDGRARSGLRALWAAGGFSCFGLGALGAVVPILPTVPFMLGAAFCFARSSARLDAWFHGTRLYRVVLEGFAKRHSMTVRAKLMLLAPVTLVLGVSFALMANVPVGRAVVAAVWVGHVVYFGFAVRTERADASVPPCRLEAERRAERMEG